MTRLRAANKPTIPTLLGEEKKANVFLRADEPSVAASVRMKGRAPPKCSANCANARTNPDGPVLMALHRRRNHRAARFAGRIRKAGIIARPFAIAARDADGRARSTAIYFLLARGERSHWHRIDAVEIWHYYAGSALTLQIADDGGQRSVRLGPDLAAGEVPQAIVPAQAWQAAESTGDWTLVGCTVAPGFDFAKFELAPKGWAPPIQCNVTPCLSRRTFDCSRFQNMSLAAISPPPAISTAAIAIFALGLAKPARIRNAVESSGVA